MLKKLNDRLEKVKSSKSPMYFAEKVIALGGQVLSDIKVQKLAGILSFIRDINRTYFCTEYFTGRFTRYLGSDVDITLPIDKPSVQPIIFKDRNATTSTYRNIRHRRASIWCSS